MAKRNDGCTNFYTCLLAIPVMGIGCLGSIFVIMVIWEILKWIVTSIF
ncbi:hypothetical protein ABEG07_04225 [Staphylococcus lugdunensis]